MTRNREPQLVGSEQLARLLETAAASTRKRSHLLLHADHQDPVQRLLIGLEPESYVRAHVHIEQWEMMVLLRGRFDFLIFNPQAELVQRLVMSVASPVAQIPRGTWHSGVALAPETLVLEIPTERVRSVGSRGRRARQQRVCALGRGREPGEQMALPRSLSAAARARSPRLLQSRAIGRSVPASGCRIAAIRQE